MKLPALALALTLATGPALADWVPTYEGPSAATNAARVARRTDQNFSLTFSSIPQVNDNPVLMNIASGITMPDGLLSGQLSTQFRAPLWNRSSETITAVAVVMPCFYASAAATGEEKAQGGTQTWKVSVEYPLGATPSLQTWGGLQSLTSGAVTVTQGGTSVIGTCPDGGLAISDYTPVSTPIPPGMRFYVRGLGTNTVASVYNVRGIDIDNGAGFQYSTTALTDLTGVGGPITNTSSSAGPGSGGTLTPLAVIGMTKTGSVILWGDSRVAGLKDAYLGPDSTLGTLDRSIGRWLPTMNLGLSNDRSDWFIASHPNRQALATYAERAIIEHGINEAAALTPAQIEANLVTMAGYLPGNITRKIVTTQEPQTTNTAQSISSLTATNGVLVATGLSGYQTNAFFLYEWVTIAGASTTTDNGPCQIVSIQTGTGFTCVNPGAVTATSVTATVTDNFQSTQFQTVASSNPNRITVNDWKRTFGNGAGLGTSAFPFTGVLGLADMVESGRNSGKWNPAIYLGTPYSTAPASFVGGTAPDGTHMTPSGYINLYRSGAITPRMVN